MEDLGENTTVLSTLRSLNNFISQRVEGGSGLDVSTSAPGSLQMQYQQSMQLEERAEQIRSRSHLIQVEREKTQMELSHKRARVELERAASASARSYEREVDRNQELLTRVRQLQEREAEAEEKVKAQLERYRSCQQSLDAASKELREKEGGLAEAGETISVLKGRLSDLQWSVMNQEMQVKRLESEKQELKEQLELQHRKWQDANQQVQELQASQDARVDHAQRVKDLEQKLALQEQDAAVVKNMRSELVRLPTMERELRQLREENACLREMRDTNGLLREELEGLQRRLGRQEKMRETLVDLELEKERLLTKLQSWERLDQTTGLSIRTPEDLSRFIVELQQRELALQDRSSSITSRLKVEELEGERSRLEEEKKVLETQLERLTLQGDYDQSRTKVLHLSLNPAGAARQRLHEDRQQLREECERLRELVRALEAGGAVPTDLEAAAGLPSSREVAELKKQVESAELKNQRLKEVFQTKIQEFRKVCYTLTGYQVDITTENQYRLTSMYAERKTDCLIFKAAGPSGTKMQLLETEFSRTATVQELIGLHLLRQASIPAFLGALTLDLFSRQTVA
ncbi:mitotic spindle assembly checkpoint protein MAD1 isoform X3 [Balaenoptera ricei]|uniref:mitotic spindle assembly checkpoint protein MAD1 isoform X3 n=1 Tax=Balaenoptera ricei TaxID=2746895 RepID=UPI0028BEAD85|nr:mitotic spindle assembly checkpoint protein MAD1 isoform X3 [Balaenoptera ricei]